MRITPGKLVLFFLIGGVLSVSLWEATYPGPFDPKGPMYQGWKLGIYPLDLDKATETMVGDGRADRLVIGKSEEEAGEEVDS